MLVLLFVALWFIIRGDLLYVLPCVILFLCFSVLLVLRLPRLGKRELILVLFVCLFDLCLFWICRFPLPLGVWEALDFSLTFIYYINVGFKVGVGGWGGGGGDGSKLYRHDFVMTFLKYDCMWNLNTCRHLMYSEATVDMLGGVVYDLYHHGNTPV